MPRANELSPIRQQRWVEAINIGAYDAPPYSVVEWTEAIHPTSGKTYLLIRRPTEDGLLNFAVNGRLPIRATGAKRGLVTMHFPTYVAVAETPAPFQPLGTQRNQFTAGLNRPGMIAIGDYANGRVRATYGGADPSCIATPTTTITARSSNTPGSGVFQVQRIDEGALAASAFSVTAFHLGETLVKPGEVEYAKLFRDFHGEWWFDYQRPGARLATALLAAPLCVSASAVAVTQTTSLGNRLEDLSEVVAAANPFRLQGAVGRNVLLGYQAAADAWMVIQVGHCSTKVTQDVRLVGSGLQQSFLTAALLSCDDECSPLNDSGESLDWTTIGNVCSPCESGDSGDYCFSELQHRNLVGSMTEATCEGMTDGDSNAQFYEASDWSSLHASDATYVAHQTSGWRMSYVDTGGDCGFDLYLSYIAGEGWVYWVDAFANRQPAMLEACDPFHVEINFSGCTGGTEGSVGDDCYLCSGDTPAAFVLGDGFSNGDCDQCSDFNGMVLTQNGSDPCEYLTSNGACTESGVSNIVFTQFDADPPRVAANLAIKDGDSFGYISYDAALDGRPCNGPHTLSLLGAVNESECNYPATLTITPQGYVASDNCLGEDCAGCSDAAFTLTFTEAGSADRTDKRGKIRTDKFNNVRRSK